MATITFYADGTDLGGSGLGFYGNGFGQSVAVGAYQDNTYITDSNGVTQGPQGNNIKYTASESGEIPTDVGLNLLDIPNSAASLQISFTHTTGVQVQSVELRIYDRSDINNAPSGVTCKVAELIHPSEAQSGLLGSGDTAWITPQGSSVVVELSDSPGESGLQALSGSGSTYVDDKHDWYVAISASPDSIGSKSSFGLYFSCEFL